MRLYRLFLANMRVFWTPWRIKVMLYGMLIGFCVGCWFNAIVSQSGPWAAAGIISTFLIVLRLLWVVVGPDIP